jgi:hypothetical protein
MDGINRTVEGSEDWLTHLNEVASNLLLKFQHRSDYRDLLGAVQMQKRATSKLPDSSPQRRYVMVNWAIISAQWFHLMGNVYDL